MNVLVYVIDSLRSDHVSSYGYERNTTPNIDSLAEEGFVFEHSYSVSTWTKQAAASILSGLYPSATGVQTVYDRVPASISTLPEILGQMGFESIGLSSTGHISPDYGFNQGFDSFRMETDIDSVTRRTLSEKLEIDLSDAYNFFPPGSATLHEHLLEFLEESSSEHTFAFLWSLDPHDPYYVSEEDAVYASGARFLGSVRDSPIDEIVDVYDDMIRLNDSRIGELVESLKDRGMYEESLIIIVGDHGEAFDEHGERGHGKAPYREQLEVPFVLKPPTSHVSTYNTHRPVQLVDVLPTVLRMVGSDVPAMIQGEPLGHPEIRWESEPRTVYAETQYKYSHDRLECVQRDGLKLIRCSPTHPSEFLKLMREMLMSKRLRERLSRMHHSYDLVSTIKAELAYLLHWHREETELYNLHEDPVESRNLATEPAERENVDALLDALEHFREENAMLREKLGDLTVTGIGSATRKQLEDLGYM